MAGAVVVRRGLPRVPGGEPWPPEGTTLAPAEASIAAEPAPVGAPPDAEPAPAVVEAPPSASPESPAAPQTRVASPSASAAPTIRRGLPRVAGGEPWPPAIGATSVAAATVPATTVPAEVAAAPAAAAPDAPVAQPPQRSAPAATPAVSAVAEPAASQVVADGAVALRRGLPRVRGGEPWPPSGTAPARASAPATPLPADTPPAEDARVTVEQSAVEQAAPAEQAAAAEPVVTPKPVAAPAPAAAAPAPAAAAPAPATAAPAPTAAATPVAAPQPAAAGTPVAAPQPAAAAKPAAAQRPLAAAATPSMRPVTARQWIATGVLVSLAIVGAATILVAIARWFVGLEPVAAFMQQYSGTYALPEGAPVGLPPWLNWAHFFNSLLIVLIIRSGLQVRYERKPDAYWTPKRGGKKTSLSVWLHTSLDVLWIVNGLVFVVLLFATGQWMRIVPTSLEVLPHAVSAGLQYVSLDWPTEHGWVSYNALQQLAYFVTVFVAAPLAIITGLRMSRWWPQGRAGLDRALPVEWARAVHFPVMLYFVVFIVTHVLLVMTTGALRNLNHMYASRDAEDWLGFALFAGSLLVIAAAWFAARPALLVPIAQRFGSVSSR